MSFQLLRFPYVALSTIMSFFDPTDIFLLSLCSKKAFQTMKSHIFNSLDLDIWMTNWNKETHAEFYSCGKKGSFIKIRKIGTMPCDIANFEKVKIKGYEIPIGWNEEEELWEAYWKLTKLGSKTIMTHICDLFKRDIKYVLVTKESFWLIDWINSCQDTLSSVYFPPQLGVQDDDFERILTWDVDHLEMHSAHASSTPRYIGDIVARKSVWMKSASWLSVSILKTLPQAEIYLEGTGYPINSVIFFLNHWLEGGSTNLQFLHFTVTSDFQLDELMTELQNKLVPLEKPRVYTSIRESGTSTYLTGSVYTFENGPELRRSDGASATFLKHSFNNLSIAFWK